MAWYPAGHIPEMEQGTQVHLGWILPELKISDSNVIKKTMYCTTNNFPKT